MQQILTIFLLHSLLLPFLSFLTFVAKPVESKSCRAAVGAAEYFREIYMRNIGRGAHIPNCDGVRRNGGGG